MCVQQTLSEMEQYVMLTGLVVYFYRMLKYVYTFWNCDAADEEQEDNSCVAHLADSCWRRLVVS